MYVKIKSWEAMVEQFGTDDRGSVNCMFKFSKIMNDLIPESRIINIDKLSGFWNRIQNFENEDDRFVYHISKDMIESEIPFFYTIHGDEI